MNSYSLHICMKSELKDLQQFINAYWRKDHILARSQSLMDWQHYNKENAKYNFVLAKHLESKEIHGVLGFIPTTHFDKTIKEKDLWMAMWKIREDNSAPGLGLSLLKYLINNENPRSISVLGISSDTIPLYKYFSRVYKDITGENVSQNMPLPMFNILNGGEHADNNIDIQEFMVIPSGAKSFVEVMQWATEIYHNLKKILLTKKYSTAVGDEGGFAPNLDSNEAALKLIVDAIVDSGLTPGKDVDIALDCAASEFFDGENYFLKGENKKLSSSELAEYLVALTEDYPIVSIEDGMDENDMEGWKLLTEKLGATCQLVGDDLFVTNKKILQDGINEKIANSILIKFNQVGSITETIQTIHCANQNSYQSIISHRSGETEDTTISDLAVGLGVSQIKTGAPCRSDRVAKYNRLLWIEEESNNILLK